VFNDSWYFPRLKKLSFLGLIASQESLQDVLTRHAATLENIDFDNVVLSSAWEPVFKTLSQLPSLTNLRLNILATTADRMEVNLEPIDRKLDPHGQSMPFKSMCVGSWPDYDEHFWYVRKY
jgi:hypothetical protein